MRIVKNYIVAEEKVAILQQFLPIKYEYQQEFAGRSVVKP